MESALRKTNQFLGPAAPVAVPPLELCTFRTQDVPSQFKPLKVDFLSLAAATDSQRSPAGPE